MPDLCKCGSQGMIKLSTVDKHITLCVECCPAHAHQLIAKLENEGTKHTIGSLKGGQSPDGGGHGVKQTSGAEAS